MIFKQSKIGKKWHYVTEDLFGEIELLSGNELTKEELDLLVDAIIKGAGGDGDISVNGKIVSFNFRKAPSWIKDEECGKTTKT